MESKYAHPEVLVETDWVHAHLGRPGLKLVEVDLDTKAYEAGHIPGSSAFNWQTQLQDPLQRDIIRQADFEKLVGEAGIRPDDTVVLWGDFHNWFAAYGFWLFKYYGHRDVRLMNGGRIKWLSEADKPVVVEPPQPKPASYQATQIDTSIRIRVNEVLLAATHRTHNLADVRTPSEFTGRVIAPPGMTETAQRGGHIPGALNIPWNFAVRADGTFKSAAELQAIYFGPNALDPGKATITYCRIGERSSHTWFVLKYLLGCAGVRNYDGSWTEYGSMIGLPIEK